MLNAITRSLKYILVIALLSGCSHHADLKPSQVTSGHDMENPLLKHDPFIRLGQEFEDNLLNKFKAGLLQKNQDVLQSLFAADYQSQHPNRWKLVPDDGKSSLTTYYRVLVDEEARATDAKTTVENLLDYRDGFESIEDSTVHHVDFYRCEGPGRSVCSHGYIRFRGKSAEGPRQDYFEFEMRGRKIKQKLFITDLKLLKGYSLVNRGKPYFTDQTAQSGIRFRQRPPKDPAIDNYKFNIVEWMGSGVAAADIDGDGREDLFFSNMDGPNQLYRNLGHGKFKDITAQSGLPTDEKPQSISAVFADLDNDGAQDLIIFSLFKPTQVFRNNGKGHFSRVENTGLEGGEFQMNVMAAIADYDNDGKLDLYVTQYGDVVNAVPETFIYSRNGRPNHLFRNLGGFKFEDVTKKAGVEDTGWSLSAAFFDYDNDGLQDLYVANDFGLNNFFRNKGDGTFENVTFKSGTVSYGAGMGVAAGDFNNDGWLDVYLSNIYSNNRWFTKYASFKRFYMKQLFFGSGMPLSRKFGIVKEIGSQFRASPEAEKAFNASLTDGNVLMVNQQNKTFKDIAWQTGTHYAQWAWATDFFDFDNDGFEDLYTSNGFHTGAKSKDT